MKQLDLILCAVAIVIGIIGSWVVYATKPQPQPAPAPKSINLTPATLPQPPIAVTAGLPGAQGGAMGRGGKRIGVVG
jgi:hypothetical protein